MAITFLLAFVAVASTKEESERTAAAAVTAAISTVGVAVVGDGRSSEAVATRWSVPRARARVYSSAEDEHLPRLIVTFAHQLRGTPARVSLFPALRLPVDVIANRRNELGGAEDSRWSEGNRNIAESVWWLRWIVEHYDSLPEYVAFLHPHHTDWHRRDLNESIEMIHTATPTCVTMLGKFAWSGFGEVNTCGRRVRPASLREVGPKLSEPACWDGAYMVRLGHNTFAEFPTNCMSCNGVLKLKYLTSGKRWKRPISPEARSCEPCGNDALHCPESEYEALCLAAAHLGMDAQGWEYEAPAQNWNEFFWGHILGSELIVSRQGIRTRSKATYAGLIGLIESRTDLAWGYAFERLYEHIFSRGTERGCLEKPEGNGRARETG